MFYENHSDDEISKSQNNTLNNSPNNAQYNQNTRQIQSTITTQPIRQNNNSEQDVNPSPYLCMDTQPPSYDQIYNDSKSCHNDNKNKECKTALCLCSIVAVTCSGCAVGCLLC